MIFAIGLVLAILGYCIKKNAFNRMPAYDVLRDNYSTAWFIGVLLFVIGAGCVLFSICRLAWRYLP